MIENSASPVEPKPRLPAADGTITTKDYAFEVDLEAETVA